MIREKALCQGQFSLSPWEQGEELPFIFGQSGRKCKLELHVSTAVKATSGD